MVTNIFIRKSTMKYLTHSDHTLH